MKMYFRNDGSYTPDMISTPVIYNGKPVGYMSDIDDDNVHLEVWDKYVTKQINNTTQSFELAIGKEPMSEDDFYNKYCATCGTQRCGGINDHIFREGCQIYQREYR